MNTPIKLVIPVEPVSKGRPRFTRHGHAYTPAKTAAAELEIGMYANHQWNRPPLIGPVSVKIAFFMPIPKSAPKKAQALLQTEQAPHWKRPDLDNMAKLVKDALNGVVWVDDGQVWNLYTYKVYSPNPRIEIEIID